MAAVIKRLSTAEINDTNLYGANLNVGESIKLYENTVSDNTTILKELSFCNTSDSPAYVTACIKGADEDVGLETAIFYGAYVEIAQTIAVSLSSVVPFGKAIHVRVDQESSTGANVNICAQGVELKNASAKQLVSSMTTDAYAVYYTTPESKTATVYQLLAVNGGEQEEKLSMQIIPPNGSSDEKNCVLFEAPIQPYETLMFGSKIEVPAGYKISVKAAASVHLVIDGTEK
jgi:hypothetical protein